MTIEILTKRLKEFFRGEKGRNITYLSAFFLVFSVFILFIIRPTLKTAFELREKREALREVNKRFEKIINKIVQVNLDAERYRDDFDLLDQAVPSKMYIFSLFRQINSVLIENDLSIENATVDRIILVREGEAESPEQDLKELTMNYVLRGEFNDLIKALKTLQKQRRIKIVYDISVEKQGQEDFLATGPANLEMKVTIKSFFK